MITQLFIEHLAKRAWANDAGSVPGGYEVALAVNAPGGLGRTSVWDDVEEMSGEGYAAQPATNWQRSGTDTARCDCAGFSNTGPVAWPAANWVVVKCHIGGGPVLCWADPIDPGLRIDPADTIVFPDGIEFGLVDGG